jgi:hypothetical protein
LLDVPLKSEGVKNSSNLKLTRTYKLGDVNNLKFVEGDVVKVALSAQFLAGASEGGYQITDILPSGMRPATRVNDDTIFVDEDANVDEKEKERNSRCNRIWYPDMIDANRVVFDVSKDFARENGCAEITINYYARVVSKGSFKADASIMQSAHNEGEYFATPSAQIEIK